MYGQRQSKEGGRASPWDALDPNFASHDFDKFIGYGQAESRTTVLPRSGGVFLYEFLEQLTFVHREGKLNPVTRQVGNDLADSSWVTNDVRRNARARTQDKFETFPCSLGG